MRALQDRRQVHHRIPRCLLRLRDAADASAAQDLNGAALQAWLDYEAEAQEHGVDPEIERDELAELVETSMVEMDAGEHRAGHAEDFRRWGRRGGLRTLALYGAPWFTLLALRRWEKIEAEALKAQREALEANAEAKREGRS